MARYKILSLDGGGIRGIISATILERLEKIYPGFISDVDLVAGTSTGGLIALGLANGQTPSQIKEIYKRLGPAVFSDSLADDVHDIGTLIGAEYSIQPLKDILTEKFSRITLGQLNKRVLIPTFDLDNEYPDENRRMWKPKFFHNFRGYDSDETELVVDVGIRTCVAPTYFPIYQGFIDGGVVAGNPSVCAIAQALNPEGADQKLSDIVLLSIGTGHNPKYVSSQEGDWGLVQWAPHIVQIMLEGGVGLADYQCEQLLGVRYQRSNPVLHEAISMDRVDKINHLLNIAENFDIDPTLEWIRRYF